MPRFSDNTLTPDEKKAVTHYVEFITKGPQPGGHALGRYGPVPEGMVIWLVGLTALVGVTLWIGARA
jgi:ubiquinol-cytochrome c reductase cytochrome c subunit